MAVPPQLGLGGSYMAVVQERVLKNLKNCNNLPMEPPMSRSSTLIVGFVRWVVTGCIVYRTNYALFVVLDSTGSVFNPG